MGPFKSTFILFAYLISRAVSAPNALQGAPPPKTPTFEWAALGDSWASGVTYSGDKDNYDDDKNCLRLEDAYSVQMKKDKSWTVNDQNFHFVACSGAQLFDSKPSFFLCWFMGCSPWLPDLCSIFFASFPREYALNCCSRQSTE
jgi:hypothetical protein